jgi:hypothetical protein
MAVDLKVTGIDGVLDLLRKLPPEVVSKRGGPVKLGRQARAPIYRTVDGQHHRFARQTTYRLER